MRACRPNESRFFMSIPYCSRLQALNHRAGGIVFPMVLLVLSLFSAVAVAAAAEIHGVKMPDSAIVEGKPLKLNGIGVRAKTFLDIKVYVAGLYVETPSHDPNKIIALDGVRQLQLLMTHDAPKAKLVDEIVTGLDRNASDKMDALRQRLAVFLGGVPDLKEGGLLTITYVPGKGTSVVGTGGDEVTVPGKDFADAVISAWLGAKPLDHDLKKHLLGE